MVKYIIRRVIWLVPVLFFVLLITFTLMHLAPGSPWDVKVQKNATPALKAALAAKYGADKPVVQQFTDYVWNALHGDLGPSYSQPSRTVAQIIQQGFPITGAIGLVALIISIIIGIPIGLIAALQHNGWFDHLVVFIVTLAYSLPNFVIGIFLIVIISVGLHLLPIHFQLNDWRTWIYPAGILALITVSSIVRITRSAVLDVLGQDYVRTAKAKGLHPTVVDVRHVLRNALIPVVSLIGPITVNLLVGSFVVESMFSVPGIGRYFVVSVLQRDYPVILGTALLYTLLVVIFNLLVDLTYSFLDPRIVRS